MPPKIIEEKSTISPGPIKEGSTLNLYCHAEGIPPPKVSWYFRKRSSSSLLLLQSNVHHSGTRNGHHSNANGEKSSQPHHQSHGGKSNSEQIIHEGNNLIIKDISRTHSGVFECIANNSVPPAASRKIRVSVECKSWFITLNLPSSYNNLNFSVRMSIKKKEFIFYEKNLSHKNHDFTKTDKKNV